MTSLLDSEETRQTNTNLLQFVNMYRRIYVQYIAQNAVQKSTVILKVGNESSIVAFNGQKISRNNMEKTFTFWALFSENCVKALKNNRPVGHNK